jgi:signal transduction histidine kinase
VSEGRVRIAVRDFGEGIEPEQLPLIWDRYYKVDRVHRRARIGTGLGLSIVKGVFELHGAQYGVNSTPGQGSEFWFSLPVVTDSDER